MKLQNNLSLTSHFLFKISGTIFLFIFLSACSKLPEAIEPSIAKNTATNVAKDKLIYVTNHGWHTGIIINVDKITSLIPALANRFNSNKYIEIGWGDAGFYQAEEITSRLTVQAIFWPTDTVVHVVGFNEKPSDYFNKSKVKKISISEDQYQNLIKYIVSSFATSDKNEIIEMKTGIYGDSQFYQGVGSYYAMNTCNTWTAKALYSAGQEINPMFKLTAKSVMESIHIVKP